MARTAATGRKRGLRVVVPVDATISSRESMREAAIHDAAPDYAVPSRLLAELLEGMAAPA